MQQDNPYPLGGVSGVLLLFAGGVFPGAEDAALPFAVAFAVAFTVAFAVVVAVVVAEAAVPVAVVVAAALPATCAAGCSSQWNGSKFVFGSTQLGFLEA